MSKFNGTPVWLANHCSKDQFSSHLLVDVLADVDEQLAQKRCDTLKYFHATSDFHRQMETLARKSGKLVQNISLEGEKIIDH